jgi:hypothetical protein
MDKTIAYWILRDRACRGVMVATFHQWEAVTAYLENFPTCWAQPVYMKGGRG